MSKSNLYLDSINPANAGAGHNDHKYWLGLKLCPELRNRLYVYVNKAGGVRRLWNMRRKQLAELGLDATSIDSFYRFKDNIDLDIELDKLSRNNVKIIADKDIVYPKQLKDSPWHPGAIFAKGEPAQYKHGIAIVGSRKATAYGKTMAYELAYDLAKSGVVVISGGARGIDSHAHKGAIDAGGQTFSVLGCGLDIIYPPENKKLFGEIEANGALLSEYPLGTPPLPHHFPIRNRIVAGMSDAVVVVEAGVKSGALLTADFALEFGRDVFSMPGYSKSEVSKGTNKLIKQGAYLIENANDILEMLGMDTRKTQTSQALKAKEQEFLLNLGWEPLSIDEIMSETTLSVAQVSSMLVKLEMVGFVRKDITGCYQRLN
jgi:DNA processing protein